MTASPNFPSIPSGWREQEFQIDRTTFARVFHREGFGKGRMLFAVHGFGEQSNRYTHLPHYLDSAVDVIVAPDLPGHGNSGGPRGHGENIDVFHEAILKALENGIAMVKRETSSLTLHCMGHSFGGLLLAHGTLVRQHFGKFPIRSMLLSAPLIDYGLPIPELKKRVGLAVEPFLGWLPLKNEVKADDLSHDPSVVETYLKEPLNHGWVTPRMFVHMSRAMEEARESSNDFPFPWALLVPMQDKIASPRANVSFYERHSAGTQQPCKLFTFPDFYHESFNETEKEKALGALKDWVVSNSQ